MNRFKTFFACGLAAIVLAGCQAGSDTSSSGSPVTASKSGKRFKIGVSIPAADHGWTAGVGYWAKEAVKLNPDIDWVVQDSKTSDDQISTLENMKTQGVDAIVILATASTPVTPIAKQLHEAGIFIVNVDRGFTEPVADVFIEGDNKAFGRKSADYMVKKLGGKGKIVILRGVESTVDNDRVEAATEIFKANPGIQIVATQRGEWNREKADKAMQNIITSNPQIDAIWAADDDMALGAETALKAAGRDKNVWILGGGGMKDIVKRVMDKDPMYPADITYPPSMIGFGIQTAAGIFRAGKDQSKKLIPRHVMIDLDLITPDNAKDYYFPDSIY